MAALQPTAGGPTTGVLVEAVAGVTGTLARTNAADTLAAAGTTTVTATVARTNANDTLSAAGVAGAVSGSASITNANDTLSASGSGGIEVERRRYTGAGPDYHVRIGDKTVRGTRQQIDALLRRLAHEHAQEDEALVEQAKAPKQRAIRIVETTPKQARAQVSEVEAAGLMAGNARAPAVLLSQAITQRTGASSADAAMVYERAYAAYLQAQADRMDAEEAHVIASHIMARRRAVVAEVVKQVETLMRALA